MQSIGEFVHLITTICTAVLTFCLFYSYSCRMYSPVVFFCMAFLTANKHGALTMDLTLMFLFIFGGSGMGGSKQDSFSAQNYAVSRTVWRAEGGRGRVA